MDFENFEGFKRVKNTKNLDTEDVLELLKKYEKKIGELKENENTISIHTEGKFFIELRVFTDEIVIETKQDSHPDHDNKVNIEEARDDLQLARTNRVIEQIYDLLNDYMKNDNITEHITAVKETLYMKERENLLLGGAVSLGKIFELLDDYGETVYEIKESKISKLFSIKNNQTNREDVVVRYENAVNNEFTILKQPFDRIDIKKDNTNNVKTIFTGKVSTKELKVSADYSDNHFLVEVNEIVIGAIDCLDPLIKKEYNLEINDERYEYLIVALAVILDIFASNNINNDEEII